MFVRAKSIFTNMTSLLYYSGSAVYQGGASGAYLVATAVYAVAATAYAVKGLTKAAYYSAKHLSSVSAAAIEYPNAIVDYVAYGEDQAWEDADTDYANATANAKVDFDEASTTFSNEYASIQQPLTSYAEATATHASNWWSSTVTATGHGLALGSHACDFGSMVYALGSLALKTAGDKLLGKEQNSQEQQANNPARLFTHTKVEDPKQEEVVIEPDMVPIKPA